MVHLKNVVTKKTDNRGKLLTFVGNSPQHAGNVCRMFDADTSREIISRDVKFINKMFYCSDMSRTALVSHHPEQDASASNSSIGGR